MNTKHAIDFNRPFAAEYARQREFPDFWARLTTASRHAMVLYFSDSSRPLGACERDAGVTNTTLRQALQTRGLLPAPVKSVRSASHAPTGSLQGAIDTLQAQLDAVEDKQRTLQEEHRKVTQALNAVKALF